MPCTVTAVLGLPYLFPLSKGPVEILCQVGRGGLGTTYCMMKPLDPVQPVLLGEDIGVCRYCMLYVTKQRTS